MSIDDLSTQIPPVTLPEPTIPNAAVGPSAPSVAERSVVDVEQGSRGIIAEELHVW